MLEFFHDLEDRSKWIFVKSNQYPWGPLMKNEIPYVQELGDFYARENFYTYRQDLPSFLLKYTVSGEGVLEYQGNTYHVGQGDAFWIDCQNYQKYYTSPESKSWHVIWVHFYGEPCKRYYDIFLERNGSSPIVTFPSGDALLMNLNSLIDLYTAEEMDRYTDIRASGIVNEIMISCILGTMSDQEDPIPDNIREAQLFMSRNFKQPIALETLSEQAKMNKYHFLRQFKQYTGFTPHSYLIMIRIFEAKRLLRFSDMTISEIASNVGIEYVGHFIELFKKSEGMTPGLYRKHWHG